MIGREFPIPFFVGRRTSRHATTARNVLSNAVANHDSKNEAEYQSKQHIHDATPCFPAATIIAITAAQHYCSRNQFTSRVEQIGGHPPPQLLLLEARQPRWQTWK